jgi:Tn3 transposase DDE domain
MIDYLRERNIWLPASTELERLALAARAGCAQACLQRPRRGPVAGDGRRSGRAADHNGRKRTHAVRRLYIVGARTAYKGLDPLIGGTIDSRIIAENWDELLRLAASIKAGTVAPSAILRRLAAYPRQNALAKSLMEIGRLERTLFMLDWISDPDLRRRTNAGLNKGEARNARPLLRIYWGEPSSLLDWVCFRPLTL